MWRIVKNLIVLNYFVDAFDYVQKDVHLIDFVINAIHLQIVELFNIARSQFGKEAKQILRLHQLLSNKDSPRT